MSFEQRSKSVFTIPIYIFDVCVYVCVWVVCVTFQKHIRIPLFSVFPYLALWLDQGDSKILFVFFFCVCVSYVCAVFPPLSFFFFVR